MIMTLEERLSISIFKCLRMLTQSPRKSAVVLAMAKSQLFNLLLPSQSTCFQKSHLVLTRNIMKILCFLIKVFKSLWTQTWLDAFQTLFGHLKQLSQRDLNQFLISPWCKVTSQMDIVIQTTLKSLSSSSTFSKLKWPSQMICNAWTLMNSSRHPSVSIFMDLQLLTVLCSKEQARCNLNHQILWKRLLHRLQMLYLKTTLTEDNQLYRKTRMSKLSHLCELKSTCPAARTWRLSSFTATKKQLMTTSSTNTSSKIGIVVCLWKKKCWVKVDSGKYLKLSMCSTKDSMPSSKSRSILVSTKISRNIASTVKL